MNPQTVINEPATASIPDNAADFDALCDQVAEIANMDNIAAIIEYADRCTVAQSRQLVTNAARVNPDIQTTRPWLQWVIDIHERD